MKAQIIQTDRVMVYGKNCISENVRPLVKLPGVWRGYRLQRGEQTEQIYRQGNKVFIDSSCHWWTREAVEKLVEAGELKLN